MSGQKVILIMFAGVLVVTAITLALYLTTRQLDSEGLEQTPESGVQRNYQRKTLVSFEGAPATSFGWQPVEVRN